MAATPEHHVLLLGGGFAGVAAAAQLERQLPRNWQPVLVNADNAHTFTPLLPEGAGSSILPGHTVAPLRQLLRRSRIVVGQVESVDTRTRTLHFANGETLQGDHLILTCGLAANRKLLPGMAEHTLSLKTVGDAFEIRNTLIRRLEALDRDGGGSDGDPRATFVVIGGGFSGIELAGQINDFLRTSLRYYPNVRRESLQVIVLHDGARILPEVPVPDRPGVWAVGDCASVVNALDGRPAPPTAQAASQAAKQLAKNVQHDIAGASTAPLYYRSRGFMATIGDQNAVAKLGRIRLAGRTAWVVWRLAYLSKVPTLSRKVRVGMEWLWACFFPPDIAYINFRKSDEQEHPNEMRR